MAEPPAANGLEASYIDAGTEFSCDDLGVLSGSRWPGFEADSDGSPTGSLLLSEMSLPADDPDGPLLDAIARLHAEQVRAQRLEVALDVSRALGKLSNSGRPDSAATKIQAVAHGRRARVVARVARERARERAACLLQARVRLLHSRRTQLDAMACRLQRALRAYTAETLLRTTKTNLRRGLVRTRETAAIAAAEHATALRRKDEAIERLIEAQLDAHAARARHATTDGRGRGDTLPRPRRSDLEAWGGEGGVATIAVARAPTTPGLLPMALPPVLVSATPPAASALPMPDAAQQHSSSTTTAQQPVAIGVPPLAIPSAMVMPMASAVPVPVAMERDAVARLREAEDLIARLAAEKADLAEQLREALDANHTLAEEATALRLAKDAAEETASTLLAHKLSSEEGSEGGREHGQRGGRAAAAGGPSGGPSSWEACVAPSWATSWASPSASRSASACASTSASASASAGSHAR
eukprot:CAMPEP_0115840796 /NCGR_PEP_ID=MMETSP0287-20121206/6956_1 /TAXON_ID=412157 /ORGANISM="Chrysochromulina rotalis, Strain UIO044" /LENGTH=470 /DNA_ID=CAMNT_0003294419 /DNA_START=49 /DNA_END=1461 /DNA_ORIENTATION=-